MEKKHPRADEAAISSPLIERRIYLIRGQKVMLDSDLAELYRVTTGNLNLAVRRNSERFPEDFMFQLTKEETDSLLLQSARANTGRGGRQTAPYAFTEQGVAMALLRAPQRPRCPDEYPHHARLRQTARTTGRQ